MAEFGSPAARIALVFEGTRGDSQPYCVAGHAFKKAGYDVLLFGASDSAILASELGLPFVAYLPAAKDTMTNEAVVSAFTANNFMSVADAVGKLKENTYAEGMETLYHALLDWKPDIVLCNGICILDVLATSRVVGCACCLLILQCAALRSNHVGALGILPRFPAWMHLNLSAWDLLLKLIHVKVTKDHATKLATIFNRPVDSFWPSFREQRAFVSASNPPFPIFIAASHTLEGGLPPDFSSQCRLLGPLLLEASDETGPLFGDPDREDMINFLNAGSPPVYMGFGSMTCENAKFMTLLSLRALQRSGQRGVLLAGWAGMAIQHIQGEHDEQQLRSYSETQVLFMDTAPHTFLFPRCSVLVHHGGAGTLNAALRSGVPSVVLPIFCDQFPHAVLVNERGVGVGMQSMQKATPDSVADAICTCLRSDGIRDAACKLGILLNNECGQANLVSEVGSYIRNSVLTGEHLAVEAGLRAKPRTATCKNTMKRRSASDGSAADWWCGSLASVCGKQRTTSDDPSMERQPTLLGRVHAAKK